MTELCQLEGCMLKQQLAYFGLKLAILTTFFKISTYNLFCPSFTLRFIGDPNKKSIGLKITILAPKKTTKWPYLNSRYFQSVRHSKSCNSGYNQYFSMILFAAVKRLNS